MLENIYLSGNFEILYPDRATLDTVLQLAERKNVVSAKIFDICIAALIIEKNIDYFATYNSNDFQDISALNPLTPQQILQKIQRD